MTNDQKFNQTPHTKWINQLFSSFTQNGDIKIYFEQKEKLKDLNPTLNLSIHPIRFADDIFLNFETNDDALKQKLKKYEVNYDIFYHHADIIKASYLKTAKKNMIKKNSLLLIGQTEQDTVVFDGKKYLSLVDFISHIKEISKNYDTVYFKPHPYAKNNKQILNNLKTQIPNISITYENIYHLLSNENIKEVVALNSSVLYEAKYFRKKVTFLYNSYFDFTSNDIGIYNSYFTSKFWSDILEIQDTNISLPLSQNRLRKSLNNFWGYAEINDEIILKNILKTKIKYLISKYIRW